MKAKDKIVAIDLLHCRIYTSKNRKCACIFDFINFIQRYEKGIETPQGPEMEGKVLTGEFELNGQKFQALDGGPIFRFNESISLLVECKDQKELSNYKGNKGSVQFPLDKPIPYGKP